MDNTTQLPVPENETKRLSRLYDYNILDTISEEQYDAITKLASYICDAPIALISLIDRDRQWFKSKQGLDAEQTSREFSFCQYAIMNDIVFEVENAEQHPLFSDNPLVKGDPNIRFYAGAPLKTGDGINVGTLCVIDREPKKLSEKQKEALETLAAEVVSHLNLRLKNVELERALDKLNNFTKLVSHDLKAPIRGIARLASFALEDYSDVLEDELKGNLDLILKRSNRMEFLIRDLLQYSRFKDKQSNPTWFDSRAAIEAAIDLLAPGEHIKVELRGELPEVNLDKVRFEQIIQNLVSNAIKYNDKSDAEIRISCEIDLDRVEFQVADNGPGIAAEFRKKIFEPFVKAHNRKDVDSSGLGLAFVKEAVEEMNGEIRVESEPGKGAAFFVCLPRFIAR